MSATFTPAPGAAPLSRMVLSQARMEARLMLRNGEQLLLAIVIPVIVLVGGVAAAGRLGLDLDGHRAVDVLTPGVLALAVMSTAFTSIAIATGFERRYGVIKLLGSSPLPRHGLLLGKVVALLNVVALQLVVLVVVGLALGWRPSLAHPPTSILALVLAVALGTAAFAALGLFVAGVLRAEATLALANLVYLLLMAGGGVVLPTTTYGSAGTVIQWLPSGALGEALRSALVDATVDVRSLLVLAVWAAVGTVLTARTFRWE
ncbi:ABC transporter permease [Nocardioides baculatus]|uniref:ABC transporter permease n=1 Tax=Nocardioides baculatus TaxID=2801337 RepID=A0ABS1L7T0_9ACTN|nr:ABC transporter permease [Nocardioides baculatus]MBL0747759.1 ABC transporter permease [Nocardioides baculatus]